MSAWSTALVFGLIAAAGHLGAEDVVGALGGAFQPGDDMVAVGPGTYEPVFPPTPAEAKIPVKGFLLDRRPVTNAQFFWFVRENPAWQRDRIASVVTDDGYLSRWASPTHLGPGAPPLAPVVRVSWFAAKAYCEARGARLPTEVEWEYAASASEDRVDGRKDPAWAAQILDWYGRPTTNEGPGEVGKRPPNYWGVEDMHGLVWEWVLDFNSTLVSGDAREGGDADRMKFCGSGALAAVDKGDYATFMRVAMRSSLTATYTTGSLGFRCARDGGKQP